jgi:hypothetical protein
MSETGPRRYLFFDDAEIESRSGLTRTVHAAVKHPGNPILTPEPAWEGPMVPSTMLYDEAERIYKMWYLTHTRIPGVESTYVTGYATSSDGLHWERPIVGDYEYEGSRENNICLVNTAGGMGMIQDLRDTDPARRFKTLYWRGGNRSKVDEARGWGATEKRGFYAAFSPDGAHWTHPSDCPVLEGTGDTESLFGWDETYGRYVAYVRPGRKVRVKDEFTGAMLPAYPPRRVIGRSESADFLTWSDPVDILLPDADDPPGAELYFMPVQRYHGQYVGITHPYVPSPDPFGPFWPELTHSRDGIRWRRLNHHGTQRLVHQGAEGSFDSGMIRCARGFFERDDSIWLYYGGWHEDHGVSRQHRHMTTSREAQRKAAAIGLATLRLDGFVSLDAPLGGAEATLTMAAFTLAGDTVTVNASILPGGSLRAALLHEDGCPVSGFDTAACTPLSGDSTRHTLRWTDEAALSARSRCNLAGAKVKLRFHLNGASLYSYTV